VADGESLRNCGMNAGWKANFHDSQSRPAAWATVNFRGQNPPLGKCRS